MTRLIFQFCPPVKQITSTVKFLSFGMPENFAVIYLKFKQKSPNLKVFCQNGANGKANSEDPDQTAPLIWVCTVCSDLFVRKHRVITVYRMIVKG